MKKEISRLPWRDPVTGMEFVRVPGGSFEMGCHANAGKCYSDEKPVRTARLDGFWMGKHEVTQGQWKRIMGSNPSYLKKGDNYPVENVSWNEVQQFIRRLNRQSSAKFRLPSEAQWEYACRAGGKAVTYGTGSGALNSSSAKYSTGDGTALVGSCDPNSLGLHDMSGNVWEWVRDKFIIYGNVGTDNPIFERYSDARVFRGGGRNGNSSKLRCSDRPRNSPSFSGGVLGFRLVRMR
ncbi:MAG: formylglycine-generating enzyme family protein [bacterium]